VLAFNLAAPSLLFMLPTVTSVNGDSFKYAEFTNGVHELGEIS
jgi:hypothetical protein